MATTEAVIKVGRVHLCVLSCDLNSASDMSVPGVKYSLNWLTNLPNTTFISGSVYNSVVMIGCN